MTEYIPTASNRAHQSHLLLETVGQSGGALIRVCRDDGEVCDIHEQGEVCVQGVCVFSGHEYREDMKGKDPKLGCVPYQ